jgi:pimeloyl-ACP methyl ester carboxylesterase
VGVVPYTSLGDGPPVVLIHGLGGFKESWGRLPGALAAAGFRVLAPDLPGHGGARRPRGARMSSAAYARALGSWMDEVGPCALLGHSLGAPVAVMVAAERPAAVLSLVLIAPVLSPRARRVPRAPIDVLGIPVAGPLMWQALVAVLRRNPERCRESLLRAAGDPSRLVPGSPEALLLQEATDRFVGADLRALATWASSSLRRGALLEAATVEAPTLIVAGERDPLLPPEERDRLRAVVPGADVRMRPGVGHFPHLEEPGAVLPAVAAHLEGAG